MTLWKWSQTAASNSNSDSTINFAENQAPSTYNDSSRSAMAAIAKARDDWAGNITTGGTSTAYTVSTSQVITSLQDKFRVAFTLHTDCGAAPTLAVDSQTAKPLRPYSGTDFVGGELKGSGVYTATYNASNGEWIVVGYFFVPSVIPSGTNCIFQQTAAPTGFTKITTYNDKAMRIVSGTASTGGSSAFTTVFAARTLDKNQLPNISMTMADPGHKHQADKATISGAAAGTDNGVFPNPWFGTVSSHDTTTTTTGVTAAIDTTARGGVSQQTIDFAVAYVDVCIFSKN